MVNSLQWPDVHSADLSSPPAVRAALTGRVTETVRFKVLVTVVTLTCGALPVLLLVLAATRTSTGSTRGAQVVWAATLAAVGALVVASAGPSRTVLTGHGIRRRWGWRTVEVPWGRVVGFSACEGTRPGVWVLRAGEAPLLVPTPWHRRSFGEAQELADRANRACGIEPPHRVGAPAGSGGRHRPPPRPLAQGAGDAEVQRILGGNVLWSRSGLVAALMLVPLGLGLPAVLCVQAATDHADTSGRAQVIWAVVLSVSYLALVALAAGTGASVRTQGLVVRTCWRRRRLPWSHIQAFVPDASGAVVLTRAGERVRVSVRLATKAGRERSVRETAYLNGTFGLGIPMRVCRNCHEQFVDVSAAACRYHPAPPVCLGTLGEGDQRRSWWMYRCCWLAVLSPIADDGRELAPPLSGGCQVGRHVAPDWVVPAPSDLSPIEASLRSLVRQPDLDDLDDGATEVDCVRDAGGVRTLRQPPRRGPEPARSSSRWRT